jgi:hypothetical protein
VCLFENQRTKPNSNFNNSSSNRTEQFGKKFGNSSGRSSRNLLQKQADLNKSLLELVVQLETNSTNSSQTQEKRQICPLFVFLQLTLAEEVRPTESKFRVSRHFIRIAMVNFLGRTIAILIHGWQFTNFSLTLYNS